jgi:hypothetical protein
MRVLSFLQLARAWFCRGRAIGNHHIGAALRERADNALTDAAIAAGHDDSLARKAEFVWYACSHRQYLLRPFYFQLTFLPSLVATERLQQSPTTATLAHQKSGTTVLLQFDQLF